MTDSEKINLTDYSTANDTMDTPEGMKNVNQRLFTGGSSSDCGAKAPELETIPEECSAEDCSDLHIIEQSLHKQRQETRRRTRKRLLALYKSRRKRAKTSSKVVHDGIDVKVEHFRSSFRGMQSRHGGKGGNSAEYKAIALMHAANVVEAICVESMATPKHSETADIAIRCITGMVKDISE